MKEQNPGLMAFDLLDAAVALAGILDSRIENNCVVVNYQFASELIRDMQVAAKRAADALVAAQLEEGGAQ